MSERTYTDEVVVYWRQIIGTVHQRGLLKERPRRGGVMLPEADAILLPDRCIFVLDMQRLGGIPREAWLDAALWAQWRAALQGRRVFVSDGGGLAITVAREPGLHTRRLPAVIPLALECLPEKPYTVTLGHTRRGPVTLDIAGEHRAILTGGTSGSGKTNLMQSVILQLAAKHTPSQVQFAIVDTKEVDFGGDYAGLPHLFGSIARDLATAAELIERIEAERLRRQALMAAAGVADWRRLTPTPVPSPASGGGEPVPALPLLLLVVDEAADFAGTPAMATLVEVARKGRAFGISVVVGTQYPTTKAIDAQIKANLPTAIAFQTRTDVESRVILGRGGAEALDRPGLALAFLDGCWETVQTLRVDSEAVRQIIGRATVPQRPALSGLEADLVRCALDELDGAFTIGALYVRFAGRISKRALTALAQQWERRGWLTAPADAVSPRCVTDELRTLLPPAYASKRGDTVTGVIGDDRELRTVIGAMTGDDDSVLCTAGAEPSLYSVGHCDELCPPLGTLLHTPVHR